MNLSFDNPSLLPLVPLVALPLLLHLLARPRPRRMAYPSLMLLARAQRNNARMKRPQHWLLLILRTIWVALFLGVFLQPRLYREKLPDGLDEYGRSVVLIVDATASMRAGEGAQSRYALAVTEAVEALQSLSVRDRANVIRARALPESFYAEPGVNKSHLIEELRRRPASLEGGNLHEAFQLALEQLRDARGPSEILLISDFQPGSLPPGGFNAPADVTVRLLSVATAPLPNQAVSAIRVFPAAPVTGLPFRLEVEVENFSDAAVRRSLHVQVGERREQQHVDLGPNGRAVLVFPLELEESGFVPIRAELEADAFPADDTLHAVAWLHDSLRAGVYGTDSTARVWRRSLEALPGALPLNIPSLQELPDDLEALLLSGWTGESLEAVQSFAARGGLLMIRPEGGSPAVLDWLGLQSAPARPLLLNPPQGLRVAEPWPELFRLFEDGRYGSPARGQVLRHRTLSLTDTAHEPLLLLDTGEAVWTRLRSEPATYLWNLGLDPADSTLAAQAEWIPLLGEWIFGARPSSTSASANAGTRLETERHRLPAARVELLDADGQSWPLQVGDASVHALDPLPPGLYRYVHADSGETLDLRAVRLPASESDLFSADEILPAGSGHSRLARAAELRTLREGRALWPLLLMLALLLAVLEHIATLRGARP